MTRGVGWWNAGLAMFIMAVMATAGHAQQQPAVVVSVRGIAPLLDDLEFIAAQVGEAGFKDLAEQLFSSLPGGNGLAGIDQSKPLGVYMNAGAAGSPIPVAFVPLTDADSLKDLLELVVADFKITGGQLSGTVLGTKVWGKVQDGYLFVSTETKGLTKLSDPTKIVNGKYDIAVEVSLASIPASLREVFLTSAETEGRKAMEDAPEAESETEVVVRNAIFDGLTEGLKELVNNGDRLTLGLNVDEETRMGSIDFAVTGKPNTAFAGALAAFGKTPSAFAAIGSDSAPLRIMFSCPNFGSAEQVDLAFNAIRSMANEAIDKDDVLKSDEDRETAKAMSRHLLDIAQATAKSDATHSGMVLESVGDKARLIGGVRVAGANAIDKLQDDIIKISKDAPNVEAKFDVAKHAGARIHSVKHDLEEEGKSLFGDELVHFAFRKDSLWFSIGDDNLTALKLALDQTSKTGNSASQPPISIRMKPAALAILLDKNDAAFVARAKELTGQPGDTLNLDVVPVAGGVKLRFEFGVDLLKLADN